MTENNHTNLEYHILIIEDNEVSNQMMTLILSNAGYICGQARDGTEAIEILN